MSKIISRKNQEKKSGCFSGYFFGFGSLKIEIRKIYILFVVFSNISWFFFKSMELRESNENLNHAFGTHVWYSFCSELEFFTFFIVNLATSPSGGQYDIKKGKKLKIRAKAIGIAPCFRDSGGIFQSMDPGTIWQNFFCQNTTFCLRTRLWIGKYGPRAVFSNPWTLEELYVAVWQNFFPSSNWR